MRTRMITATLAATALATMTLYAQAPATPQTRPQTPSTTQPQTERQRPTADTQRSTTDQVVMITGCLKDEKDVPGLKPNVAERAGMGEDYILTGVKMSSSSKVSGIALADRYEIEGISKDELKKHLNHQVELTGKISQAAPAGNDATADFTGTSIKMLAATCPAQ